MPPFNAKDFADGLRAIAARIESGRYEARQGSFSISVEQSEKTAFHFPGEPFSQPDPTSVTISIESDLILVFKEKAQ